MNENINEIIKKYIDVSNNKEKSFDKMSILLPEFLYDFITEESENIEQVRMSKSIFISLIVEDYYKNIQELYSIDPALYDEERQKYVRKQLPITIIPETMDTIDEIKKLISTSDRVGVIKSSIEHYLRTKKEKGD